jgi:hypothetical protein
MFCKICNKEKYPIDFYNINKKSKSTCKKCICRKKSIKYFKSLVNTGNKQSYKKNKLISICNSIYGDSYIYNKVEYSGSLKKVNIICKIHGDFYARPNHLKKGHGCPKCGNENKGFSKKRFIKQSLKSYCYVIICKNELEEFVKIGITKKEIDCRFSCNKLMPYKYQKYLIIEGDSEFIFNIEKKIHKEVKNFKYRPLLNFPGSVNECFKIDCIGIIEYSETLLNINYIINKYKIIK